MERAVIISNLDSENRWHECQKVGIFTYWHGPSHYLLKLTIWLQDFFGNQVSISHYSNRLIYIHCNEECVTKDLLYVSVFYYKGYVVKLFEWIPDCNENQLDFPLATWITIPSLPLELLHVEIIRNFGFFIGDLIGIDSSYNFCNNVKLLINFKTKNPELKPIKIISNRSIYNLNLYKCEDKISKIIRLNDERKIIFKTLPKT